MKKIVISIVLVALALVVLGTAGFVYAQTGNPQGPQPGAGYGRMMGGRGGMMGQNGTAGDQSGWMHDEMVAAFAAKLGMAVEDVNTRLAQGETMAQVAASKGITAEQFASWMADVRSQALDAAVKSGKLTQAQADWMKQRGAGMGAGTSGRGARGMMQGRNGADCPMLDGDETN